VNGESMRRLIFVPQFPANMRYQSWWFHTLPSMFKKYFDHVVILGSKYVEDEVDNVGYSNEMFSPIHKAIDFETYQMNEYMELTITPNDTLFLADISFPGLFANILYHKPCKKTYAFCHATSVNKYDYFSDVKDSKKRMEILHASMFKTVFFGSQYSLDKVGWKNGKVVYLPEPPSNLIYNTNEEKRDIDIISVCRPTPQKVTLRTERYVEKHLGIRVQRQHVSNWKEYSKLLSRSKILLITTKEDTFNYTILDAIRCGCIPIVPDKLCFPEILPSYWRYRNDEDLVMQLRQMLKDNHLITPRVICQDKIVSFYDTICKIMKEE